ncbi:L,D-transpeptidase family protein [Nibrella saemangeumensis]|uniref:L,D-transpeptidase family protein n=1 Tax=Nibrella saemangeumensis TaxID=1084526 RepID=A0ABP8MIN1_9BACT
MKLPQLYIFLLGLLAVTACDKVTKSGTFLGDDNGPGEYLETWVDSTRIKKDLPKINDEKVAPDLYAFYRNRDFSPAWNRNTAEELLGVLQTVDQEGFNPEAYPIQELRTLLDSASSDRATDSTVASLDILLSASYLKLAEMMATGKVNPGKFSDSWHIKPESPDTLYTHLEAAVGGQGQVNASLDSFRPRFAQYEKLKQHLKAYRKIMDQGGWPQTAKGPALRPGATDQRLTTIRQRLYMTGDLETPPDQWQQPTRYDSALVRAVNRYQARNGLVVEPAITDSMVASMNVPVETRLKQILLNLDRTRWFASSEMPPTYVFVNVPEYKLRVMEGGNEVREMKVVVGKDLNATPIFSDMIEYVEFSPYWNVPESIAEEELWPKIKADPGYLSRQHMEILNGWDKNAKVVNPSQVNWSNLKTYRIRQKPGPWNALGRVKFMFPNEHAIYLHDTPDKHIFDETQRAFSHGCIRVEDPVWLGDWLLPQLNEQQVTQKMNGSRNESVRLAKKVPVFIFYLTAFEDDEGRLNFREDLYELDKQLTSEFDSVI